MARDETRAGAADPYDNRATVHLGGRPFELIASKGAERIYGERFRFDPDALSDERAAVPERVTDGDGNASVRRVPISYTGRLRADLVMTANLLRTTGRGSVRLAAILDYPVTQLMAAVWAMARAAGSTDMDWDEWEVWTWTLPSSAKEDEELWEAVCVDLFERAFFRDLEGAGDAPEPDPDGARATGPADGSDG